MTAMAYDRTARMTIETNSRKRTPKDQMANLVGMLTEEHDRTKKTILREITAASTERKTKVETIKTVVKESAPSRHKRKGKGKRGGKGRPNNNGTWNTDNWAVNWNGDQNQNYNQMPGKKGKGKKKRNDWPNNGWNDWSSTNSTGKGQQTANEIPTETETPAAKSPKVKAGRIVLCEFYVYRNEKGAPLNNFKKWTTEERGPNLSS